MNIRERRDLGLTLVNLIRHAKAIKDAGQWDPEDRIGMVALLAESVVRENPTVCGKPGFDWDAFLAFIEKLLPLLLLIFGL